MASSHLDPLAACPLDVLRGLDLTGEEHPRDGRRVLPRQDHRRPKECPEGLAYVLVPMIVEPVLRLPGEHHSGTWTLSMLLPPLVPRHPPGPSLDPDFSGISVRFGVSGLVRGEGELRGGG